MTARRCLQNERASEDGRNKRQRYRRRRAWPAYAAAPPPIQAQPDPFAAAASADALFGVAVKLTNSCSGCGDPVGIVGPGKPPHCTSVLCRSCGLHRCRISRANYTFLKEIISKFGAPSEPIVFRSRSTKPEENDDGTSVVQVGTKKE
jgi:hypothetical protein